MQIGFDNDSRLCRNVYYFEYKGIRFKLIQNNSKKWQDVLLTIISGIENQKSKNIAYNTASEYLSALSWANSSLVKASPAGGGGFRENRTLRNAKCTMRTRPLIPSRGWKVGYDICHIPMIENEDQKNALTLFREASCSNNFYLAFLFFWQILEIGKGDAIGWANKAYRKKRGKLRVTNDMLNRLPLNGQTIGNYFYRDCRCAVSHIIKLKKGAKLKIDTPEDNTRMQVSTWVIKEFARLYICEQLKVEKQMILVRKNGKGFPIYVDEKLLAKTWYAIAYKKLTHEQFRKKWGH